MAIIGAILGDIAGSPFEHRSDFLNMKKRQEKTYDLFDKNDDLYEFTDDTIMSIACMKACEDNFQFAKYYKELGQQFPYADYGNSFRNWLHSNNVEGYNSYGNGSAMRVSYCGEKFPLESTTMSAGEAAKMSAECTHNHPEGIKGAITIANCIAMAKIGKTKDEILSYAINQYPSTNYKYGCDIPYDSYKDTMTYDVTCMGSVPVAIRCFYESKNFEDCCKKINAMRCDTDTLCAIAGGLCEEFYGNCMGSKEKDEELLRKFLPEELLEELENAHIIEDLRGRDDIDVF